ncbi:N-(5'-phosphoribosyl)anthranilate isomerase [Luteolibacter algae]|uniref:N-(5'-phosphoribosyl)anthranilate isomerase n=1 Tax=Luteolibacter algae TaxID=454151 RepID=A0ABW5D9I5_9BACT
MSFFDPGRTSLKVCGVTREADALRLVDMGVDAVGFNFWPKSKRYLDPEKAVWSLDLAEKILRVGVFVNERGDLPYRLFGEGLIDVVQLHGDEAPEITANFVKAGIPVIKAVGVKDESDLSLAGRHDSDAILLDAHAPQVFGGTGVTFDWRLAKRFQMDFPEKVLILAGGITAENAAEAVRQVAPAALDVASGAEISPGIKDFEKVAALLAACRK